MNRLEPAILVTLGIASVLYTYAAWLINIGALELSVWKTVTLTSKPVLFWILLYSLIHVTMLAFKQRRWLFMVSGILGTLLFLATWGYLYSLPRL